MFKNLSPNGRGMLAITGASVTFVFSDALAKLSSLSWPVAQFMVVRGLFAIVIAAFIVVVSGERTRIGAIARPLVLVRSVLEALVGLSFLTALSMMPLADLTALLMLSPLVITIFAMLVFGEVVRWRRWAAILTGFTGMVLPGGAASAAPNYMLAVSLGLLAVVGVAARDIVTRRLGDDIPSVVVMLATAIGSCTAGVLMSMITPWKPFAWTPFLLCAGTSLLLTFGNFLMILSCRGVDLSVVAPYRYSAVIWSIALGALVFGDMPNALAIFGMVLIVASGIYTLHRERVRRRESERKNNVG